MAWIRDQEQTQILNVNAIWSEPSDGHYVLMAETAPNGPHDIGWPLGDFPDRETIMHELDRIEAWLANGGEGVYLVSQP